MWKVTRKRKVEPCSTFTFTNGFSYIASVSFTHVNFSCVRTEKLRNSGNQPRLIFTRVKNLRAHARKH